MTSATESSKNIGPTSSDTETCEKSGNTTSNQLTLFAEGFRAKTFPRQDNEKGSLLGGVLHYTGKCLELLAIYDQDTQSLKMSQPCLPGEMGNGSTGFFQTWPRSGLMQSGKVYHLEELAPHMRESERGLLPTPVKADGEAPSLKATLRSGETWETISGLTGILVAKTLGLHGRQILHGKNFVVNPRLTENMMGFPINHTKLDHTGMP